MAAAAAVNAAQSGMAAAILRSIERERRTSITVVIVTAAITATSAIGRMPLNTPVAQTASQPLGAETAPPPRARPPLLCGSACDLLERRAPRGPRREGARGRVSRLGRAFLLLALPQLGRARHRRSRSRHRPHPNPPRA